MFKILEHLPYLRCQNNYIQNRHCMQTGDINRLNRGVSHYQILPVSRDIGWPVQQLDYFRYIKQHILTIELLYIGYNFKEIKKRQLLIEEPDKTACHYGHLWLHLYTVFILCWPKLHPVLSSMSARGPFENNKILRTCLSNFDTRRFLSN